jgi:hypothetical protein
MGISWDFSSEHGDFMRFKQWKWGSHGTSAVNMGNQMKWDDVMGWDKVGPKKNEVDLNWAPYHVMTRRIRWFLAINSLGIHHGMTEFFGKPCWAEKRRNETWWHHPNHPNTWKFKQHLGNDTGWSLFPEPAEELGWNHERIQVAEMMGWDDKWWQHLRLKCVAPIKPLIIDSWFQMGCWDAGMIWMLDNLRYDFGKFWDNEDRVYRANRYGHNCIAMHLGSST